MLCFAMRSYAVYYSMCMFTCVCICIYISNIAERKYERRRQLDKVTASCSFANTHVNLQIFSLTGRHPFFFALSFHSPTEVSMILSLYM